ncbi:transposase, partial [Cylindrospermopsis raciborskii C03]
ELREQDKSIKIPTAIDLHKKLVAEVKSQHDWYYEVNKNVPQKALADCRVAWDRCFKRYFSFDSPIATVYFLSKLSKAMSP